MADISENQVSNEYLLEGDFITLQGHVRIACRNINTLAATSLPRRNENFARDYVGALAKPLLALAALALTSYLLGIETDAAKITSALGALAALWLVFQLIYGFKMVIAQQPAVFISTSSTQSWHIVCAKGETAVELTAKIQALILKSFKADPRATVFNFKEADGAHAKLCPGCSEIVKDAAAKCLSCGHQFAA